MIISNVVIGFNRYTKCMLCKKKLVDINVIANVVVINECYVIQMLCMTNQNMPVVIMIIVCYDYGCYDFRTYAT
jgi:hypothetical protein